MRLVASKTQRYIDDITQTIDERFNDAIWLFVIGWAIDSGLLPAENWWWYCAWTHPRKLTVDAGREEQQNRANVEMGLKTLEESFAECGLDYLFILSITWIVGLRMTSTSRLHGRLITSS